MHLSAGRLSVMPGGGVSAQNVAQLVRLTGAGEVHASARGRRRSLMAVPAGVSMGAASDERCWLQCDPDQVRAIRLGEALAAVGTARCPGWPPHREQPRSSQTCLTVARRLH